MKVCGLDLSLTATGFCELGGALTVLETINPGKIRGMQRLEHIRSTIMKRVEDAELVVMEGLSFAARSSSAHELAGLHYIIRFSLWHKGIPTVIVAPATLKKFVTGKGNAEKSMMLREVWRRWDFEAANDNEADSAGLARIGLSLMGAAEPEIEAQRDVLKTLAPQMEAIRKVA